MKNAELKKGLDLIIEGLSVISNSLVTEEVKESKEIMNPPVEKSEEPKEDAVEKSDDLDTMKIAELKKKAKELGIDPVGTRKELISSIREALENGVEEEPEEVAEEDVAEEEPSEDEFIKQAKEVAEEEDADDIIEALKDVGIKATKKNYVDKLAEALRDGLLSLDDDDEESEEEEEVEDDEAEESEVSLGEYNPNFDPDGYNDPKAMSKKRKASCDKLVKETLKKIEDEEIGRDDIIAFLDDILTDDEKDLLEDDSDDNIISMYLEVLKRQIDVDGERTDLSEPYEIEEETPMCCAHKLKFDKKENKYICEICGEEYEADDED